MATLFHMWRIAIVISVVLSCCAAQVTSEEPSEVVLPWKYEKYSTPEHPSSPTTTVATATTTTTPASTAHKPDPQQSADKTFWDQFSQFLQMPDVDATPSEDSIQTNPTSTTPITTVMTTTTTTPTPTPTPTTSETITDQMSADGNSFLGTNGGNTGDPYINYWAYLMNMFNQMYQYQLEKYNNQNQSQSGQQDSLTWDRSDNPTSPTVWGEPKTVEEPSILPHDSDATPDETQGTWTGQGSDASLRETDATPDKNLNPRVHSLHETDATPDENPRMHFLHETDATPDENPNVHSLHKTDATPDENKGASASHSQLETDVTADDTQAYQRVEPDTPAEPQHSDTHQPHQANTPPEDSYSVERRGDLPATPHEETSTYQELQPGAAAPENTAVDSVYENNHNTEPDKKPHRQPVIGGMRNFFEVYHQKAAATVSEDQSPGENDSGSDYNTAEPATAEETGDIYSHENQHTSADNSVPGESYQEVEPATSEETQGEYDATSAETTHGNQIQYTNHPYAKTSTAAPTTTQANSYTNYHQQMVSIPVESAYDPYTGRAIPDKAPQVIPEPARQNQYQQSNVQGNTVTVVIPFSNDHPPASIAGNSPKPPDAAQEGAYATQPWQRNQPASSVGTWTKPQPITYTTTTTAPTTTSYYETWSTKLYTPPAHVVVTSPSPTPAPSTITTTLSYQGQGGHWNNPAPAPNFQSQPQSTNVHDGNLAGYNANGESQNVHVAPALPTAPAANTWTTTVPPKQDIRPRVVYYPRRPEPNRNLPRNRNPHTGLLVDYVTPYNRHGPYTTTVVPPLPWRPARGDVYGRDRMNPVPEYRAQNPIQHRHDMRPILIPNPYDNHNNYDREFGPNPYLPPRRFVSERGPADTGTWAGNASGEKCRHIARFCVMKDPGIYGHPDKRCFIQCDYAGGSQVQECPPGTLWAGPAMKPASYNMCTARTRVHGVYVK